MTAETRVLLANCAGSFLLLLAFVMLALLTVLAIMMVRGAQQVRRVAPLRMQTASRYAWQALAQTRDTAAAVVEPQIRIASTLAGLKAGLRTITGGARRRTGHRDDDPVGPA